MTATGKRTTKSNNGVGRREAATVVWHREGKPITRRYFLGFMANDCTKGIARAERLSTDEFRKLLADNGVKDPENTTWQLTLPNGVTVGALHKGDKKLPTAKKVADTAYTKKNPPGERKARTAAPVAKAAVKKSPRKATSKAQAKKRTAPAAKKATGKGARQVTPIPKKSPAKKRTAAKRAVSL